MGIISRVSCAALAVLAWTAGASAATQLTANMTNAGEPNVTVPTLTNGNPRPASFGTATLVLNDAQTSMTFFAEVHNLDFTGSQTADVNDNLLNAHIHAGPNVTPTTNGPVVWGFLGNPFNDNNPNDLVVTPFANGVGGTVSGKWDAPEGNNTTLAAQLTHLLNNRAYVNFHTTQFGGGEIRGMITVVPEPTVALLMGLGGLALLRRRRPVRIG